MTGKHLFLSYARSDSVLAHRMYSVLQEQGFEVRRDQGQTPGLDWAEQIFHWIAEADACIVLITAQSAASLRVKHEVLVAFDLQRPVIPVVHHVAPGGLWLLIRTLQWVDARGGRDPMTDLLALLHKDGDRSSQPGAPRPGSPLLQGPPWIRSAGDSPQGPGSGARMRIMIELQGSAEHFLEHEQEALMALLARFGNITASEIHILQVEAGSIRITLELPEQTGRWLLALYRHGDPLVEFLDIRAVRRAPGGLTRSSSTAGLGHTTRRDWTTIWSRLSRPVLGLATALALAWGLAQQVRISNLEQQIVQQQAQVARNREIAVAVFGNDDALNGRLEGTAVAPDISGKVWVSPSGPAVTLYAKDLPPLPEGQRYQLWIEQDEQVTNLGPLSVDKAGRTWSLIQPPQLPPKPTRIFITAEPEGGNLEPTGPEYVSATLSEQD